MDCGAFVLWWRQRGAGEAPVSAGPRLCAVAPGAALRSAVQRNRAKRRFRELFRLHQASIDGSLDLMLLARSKVNQLDYSDLEQAFLKAAAQLPHASA